LEIDEGEIRDGQEHSMDLVEVTVPYGSRTRVIHIPHENLLAVLSPRMVAPCSDPDGEIRRALLEPIGVPALREAARGAGRVVILADDMTRQTPVEIMVPALLDELNGAGVRDDQVTVVIALGTHRPMTSAEIEAHFGLEVIRRVKVINNPWQDPDEMVDLGVTENGTPVSVSKVALSADFLIGVGSVVPHHIPGYSGGAKIVQPGITGAATTGATHYLSTRTRRSYLGIVDNVVRAEMEMIASRVGLKAIFNVVLNPTGDTIEAFYGDPILAHRAAADVSRQVYGVELPGYADIVIAGSHPCDIEFWQAHKSLYPADMAVRAGGTIIVLTPCPEGVAVMHSEMLAFTALSSDEITAAIDSGEISDVVSGALALAWARVREHARICLVSDGITPEETRALGFTPYANIEAALLAAFEQYGPGAQVTGLTHAPDSLPYMLSS
jgi:lactate racemase